MSGADQFGTGLSLTARTERIHSDGAIPSTRKWFLPMCKPFQHHMQGLPLQYESCKYIVRVTSGNHLPTVHPHWPSQTSTFSDLEKFPASGEIAWVNCLVLLKDRSEWCCWLTSRENSHNAHTDSITIRLEAVSAAVFPASWEQSWIAAQFTASVLIIPRISLPCQVTFFHQSIGLVKCLRLGYHNLDVNWLSNWSLTFLAFRYLSSQCNKSLTKPRSSWCNSSGCHKQ